MNKQHPLPPTRVAAIHDLSCFGRCALTVIIPTLSVMGHQVIPIPTALLSTHTGGFHDLHFRDLSADMEPIAAHLESLPTAFGAIYTGFLGSEEQIGIVQRFIERFADKKDESESDPLILIDPVMGDGGELYSTYTDALCQGTKRLVSHAHVMTPNLTEACILTDTPYRETAKMSDEDAFAFAHTLMDRLDSFRVPRVVITGIFLADGTVANLGKDANGTRFLIRRPLQKQSYPGTGDLFASVLLGDMLRGDSFEAACRHSADFVAHVVEASSHIPTPVRDGVALESHLWRLARCPENS